MKRPVLGRGLDAILPRRKPPITLPSLPSAPPPAEFVKRVTPAPTSNLLAIEKIVPNPDQPRKKFDPERLEALAASLKRDGVLQPILVKKADGDQYVIIAGERRWQAAKIAGLKELPVIVRDPDARNLLSLALIENLQREDLNAVEEAQAYEKLARDFGMRHEEIAERTGRSRSSVTNTLRLLALPAAILEALRDGQLTAGQARPLVGLDSARALTLFKKAVADGLSAREIEQLASPRQKKAAKPPASKRLEVSDTEARLSRIHGRKVQIVGNEKKGYIRMDYYSKEDLISLAERLLEE